MKVPFVDLTRAYQSCQADLDRAVAALMASGAYILGKTVDRFESEFADYCQVSHAASVNSGMLALELGMLALGIGPGDEVITPVNSFIASSASISAIGATPVWVDVDPVSHNICPRRIGRCITPKTRAIMAVHLYGQAADMDAVCSIAKAHDLYVIEDACQAHGARYRGRRTGSLGHFAAFSFYPSKNLGAMGDGGIVVTDDADLAESVRVMRHYGQDGKHCHRVMPRNRRLDALQAAILSVKLRHLDPCNSRRRQIARRYDTALADTPLVTPHAADECEHVYHLYVVETEDHERLTGELARQGIETGRHYPTPIHLQPAYASRGFGPGSFPVAERDAQRIVSLPIFPQMTDQEVDHVAATVAQLCCDAPF